MGKLLLLVGLGNPGKAYEKTRHNLGFQTLQETARRYDWVWKHSSLYRSVLAQGRVAGKDVCLLLPQTMMNLSGMSVGKFVKDREIDLTHLWVVSDDFNLEFGQIRVRRQGSDGGHNGLKSIVACLDSRDFARLRLGIGQPPRGVDPADYVLSPFSNGEQKKLKDFIQEAADCCDTWINEGIDKVMNVFNKRKGDE